MPNLAPIKAKANANYTCQECGTTELIQAHHETPGDDSSLVVLCANCHSQRHPDVPRAVFFNKLYQPYWENKSAASLAKEIGVHSRTVIRTAKRLGISQGNLSTKDESLIRNNIPKLVRSRLKKDNEEKKRLKQQSRATEKLQRACNWCKSSENSYELYQRHCPLLALMYNVHKLPYRIQT